MQGALVSIPMIGLYHILGNKICNGSPKNKYPFLRSFSIYTCHIVLNSTMLLVEKHFSDQNLF